MPHFAFLTYYLPYVLSIHNPKSGKGTNHDALKDLGKVDHVKPPET